MHLLYFCRKPMSLSKRIKYKPACHEHRTHNLEVLLLPTCVGNICYTARSAKHTRTCHYNSSINKSLHILRRVVSLVASPCICDGYITIVYYGRLSNGQRTVVIPKTTVNSNWCLVYKLLLMSDQWTFVTRQKYAGKQYRCRNLFSLGNCGFLANL